MTGEQVRKTLEQLEERELVNLDKALGTIHEVLPEIYNECNFATLQRINSTELHRCTGEV